MLSWGRKWGYLRPAQYEGRPSLMGHRHDPNLIAYLDCPALYLGNSAVEPDGAMHVSD